ncbi:PetM family of cytochrome b6f complex subunit 7 [Methylobacterium organophilum]|uniref:PetM family of cytochrome b6f complex subunit 7 n=1 Tax=Methylobacterium organophilum TaxID=410 RepID=A0ABQ4TAE8_METOR|nr:PetM family of cytochrome b6f complex subunit 7 [Methylobacterium organophilum]UMY18081.1 PetM family of cytochrome b6f complex subunit 7 [Methylobacterium organophilum]GJE28647.1 hypothetical protein LKMONMHP_3520 [Methylobacterium organophilum]
MLRSLIHFLGLPFLARALGYLSLAGGFVLACYDGSRSIANNTIRVTSVSDLLIALAKDKSALLQQAVEGAAPLVWKILVLPLTLAPAAAVALALGAFLLWLGQPAREPIGFLTRP